MTPKNGHIYEFGDFRLQPSENLLEKDGKPVLLKPKAFAALVCLVDNRGKLVEKSEMLDRVWGDAFVEEAIVSKCIWEIRTALGDNSKGSRFIQTVPKRGYRFVAETRITDGRNWQVLSPTLIEQQGQARTTGPREANVISILRSAPQSAELAIEPAMMSEPELPAPTQRPDFTLISPVERKRWLSGYLMAAIIAASLVVYVFYRTSTPPKEPKVSSLAVLPLRPVIASNRDQALEFAIAESLILKMSEAKNLNVKQLFAVRKFTDLENDPIDAGRELHVDYVLTSNYQISDGRIRVASQLVNIGTGETEQTFRSETDVGNLFAVQDTVSNQIGNALFAKFGAPPDTFTARRGTENERAYSLYHEALYLVDKVTLDDSIKAVELLDQAVNFDPDYAAAWAVKAQAYCQFAHLGGGAPAEIFSKAKPNLERALAIDPNNAVALTVKGIIDRDYNLNLPDAYKDLRRAVELDPNLTIAHRVLAGVYYRDHKFVEALEEQKRAIDLNPTGMWDKWFLADYQVAAGYPEDGIANLKQLTEIDPTFELAYDSLWQAYAAHGDTAKACEYFIRSKQARNEPSTKIDRFRMIYEKSGWDAALKAELALMRSQDTDGKYSTKKIFIAELASQVGEKEVAFHYLDEAFRFRVMGFSCLKVDPLLNPLRDSPRYKAQLSRTQL